MSADPRPNILLVMCDQLTAFLTGAYGHSAVRTPNLDQMAKEGVRFDAAYTPAPLCAPARAALLTGRQSSNIGCYDNATAFASDIPTFAHYLASVGYETVLCGKMHFIGADQLHGFRTRLTPDVYPANYAWLPGRDPKVRDHEAGDVLATAYVTAGVRDWSIGLGYDAEVHFRALEYLHSRSTPISNTRTMHSSEPFLLCVSYHHPHDPFFVTKAMWDEYADVEIALPSLPTGLESTYSTLDRWLNWWHGVEEVDLLNPTTLETLRRCYYGLTSDIDKKLGELLATLEESGLRENTLVIFVSDHGDMLGERGMVQKRTFYEWSSRIPLVVQLPGRWDSGGSVVDPVSLIDLCPTFCELACVKENARFDGESLVPVLDGGRREERVIISESHADGVYAPCFMVRKGQYKLVEVHGHDRQLFDLEADPGEWVNLIDQPHAAKVEKELMHELTDRFDPDALEEEIRASLQRRTVVREAMRKNGTAWDYQPHFDAQRQYWRFE